MVQAISSNRDLPRASARAIIRSHITANVFADNMFGGSAGSPLRMGQLNPAPPDLVINATVGSRAEPGADNMFGSVFTFTHDDFAARACSDIGSYGLARAVMTSSSFPGVFGFMTCATSGRLNAHLRRKLLFIRIDFQALRDRALQRQLRSISTFGPRKAGKDGLPLSEKEALERW